jgi:hypothetical protein
MALIALQASVEFGAPSRKRSIPPFLVGLEVEEDHVLELAGIEYLRDPVTDALVQPVHARVDERGALVVDQELIELKLRVGKLKGGADPVDPVDELIYAGHGWRSSLSSIATDARFHRIPMG